jgi:antitoxin component of MazEF toxin-antitoxin module
MFIPNERSIAMQMTIKKWGNSLATRIPKAIAETTDLQLNQLVDIEVVNGKIIITPIERRREYKLDELLRQCKPGAMKIDKEDRQWLDDKPVGREVW